MDPAEFLAMGETNCLLLSSFLFDGPPGNIPAAQILYFHTVCRKGGVFIQRSEPLRRGETFPLCTLL